MGIIQWLTDCINRLADWRRRRNTEMICMRQEDTWCWPPHLDTKTAGTCRACKAPIFFEAKNAKYRKVCNRCWDVKERLGL